MASANTSLLSLLHEDVKCAFCLDQLKTPRVLTCLHSFCEKCLKKYQDENRTPGRIVCPVCQEETVLQNFEIAGLRSDFRAIALIERLEKEKGKQQKVEAPKTCEVCGNIDSDGTSSYVSCAECEQIMCKQCGILHQKIRSCQNHTLTAVSSSITPKPEECPEEPDNSNECGLCEKHEERKMDLFCITCLTPVCQECSLDDHRPDDNHECVPIEEYASVMREEILSRLSKVPELSADKTDVIATVNNVEGYVKNLDDKIQAAFTIYTDRWRADLNKKKGTFLHLPMQTLQQIRKKAKDHLDNLEKRQKKAKEVLVQNKHFSLASAFKELRDSLDTLLCETPDRSSVEAISKTIYQLQFQVNDETSVWSLVTDCGGRRNIGVTSLNGPYAVTFTRDGRLAVIGQFEGPSESSSKMSYYQKSYSDTYSQTSKLVWEKCIYNAIKQTNTSYRVALKFGTERRLHESCNVVSSLSDHQFAVSGDDDDDPPNSNLSLLNEECTYISTCLGSISDIVVDLDDNIYYSSPELNQICIIRPNGTQAKTILTGDLSPDNIAVCPCSPDQIMFTHDSSKVSVIDLDGKLLRTITRAAWKEVVIGCDNKKLLYVLWKSVTGLRTLQKFTIEGHLLDTLFDSEGHSCQALLLSVSPGGSAAVVTSGGRNGNVTVISSKRKVDSYDV